MNNNLVNLTDEDSILIEIKQLIDGIDDKEKALDIVREYFYKKMNAYRQKIQLLSDDELDAVAGGAPKTIGDILDCEYFKLACKSFSYGIDICSIYQC